MLNNKTRITALKISVIYGAIGTLWILLSDKVVDFLYHDPKIISSIQTYKGWFYVLLTAYLVYFLIKRDLNKVESAQNELTESEEKFRTLADNSTDVIMRFDSKLRHLYVSPSIEKYVNLPRSSFIGRTHEELGFPKALTMLWSSALEEVFKSGIPRSIEFRLDDDTWFDWLITPEIEEDGEVKTVVTSARNISEKKLIQRKLKTSEDRFRMLFEAGNDAVILMKDGKIFDCNGKACELLEATKEEILGKTPFEFSPEFQPDGSSSAKRVEEIQDGLLKGEPQTFEWQHKTNKGMLIDVEVSLSAIQIANSMFIQAIVRDISERKTYQEALEFTQYTMDISNEAVYWINKFGAIIYANVTATDMLNHPLAELKKKYIWEIDTFYSKDSWKETWERIKETKKIYTESFHTKNDGKLLPVEIFGSYVEYVNNEIFCTFVRDITERKIAEKNLIEGERRFRSLLNSTAALIFIIVDNKIVFANDVSLSSLGYKETEIAGRDAMDFIHPDFREKVILKAQERIEGRIGPDRYVLGCLKSNGEKLLLDFTSDTIIYNGERGIIGTAIDITEKLEALKELEESHIKYKELYEQSSKILENERKRLSKELHDVIGQRLTFTKVHLELFEEENKHSDPKLQLVMENLVTLGEDLRAVVQSLTPSVIEEYKLEEAVGILIDKECKLNKLKVDFNTEINNVINDKSVELEVYRIIQEAITNIIKHSKADKFSINLITDDSKLECSIKDNGVGFEKGNLEKNSSWGLVHMKDRAKILGGNLNVESSVEDGTVITLEVPLG